MSKLEFSAKEYRLGFALLVSLFFMWAVAHNLNDILIRQFKKAFELSDLQSGLVQSAFFLGYFIFAMPAAVFMRKFGYKNSILFGLLLYALGAFAFYPAAEVRLYGFFLLALFVIASGLAFLETAANPYVAGLGSPQTASQRLNFAQSFNPLGAIAGVMIGRQFIFSGVEYTPDELAALSEVERIAFFTVEAEAVQVPYLILGLVVLVWAAAIFFVKLPQVSLADNQQHAGYGFSHVWKYRHCWLGVIAQFFYVGVQVGIWSFLIRYAQVEVPGTPEKTAADYLTLSLVLFLIGRFVGTAIMRVVKPNVQMGIYSAVSAILCIAGVVIGGKTGLYALIFTSFFMSIMFPTIFALSIHQIGPATKAGSALLVMAIIGGAIFPALMGFVSDQSTIKLSFLVPFACFVVVFGYSIWGWRPHMVSG